MLNSIVNVVSHKHSELYKALGNDNFHLSTVLDVLTLDQISKVMTVHYIQYYICHLLHRSIALYKQH